LKEQSYDWPVAAVVDVRERKQGAMNLIDPATGKELGPAPYIELAEAQHIVERAHRAFEVWSRATFAQRAELLRKLAATLREQASDLALIAAKEMGKPVVDGEAEANKCAWACDYYAEHGAGFLAPSQVQTDAERSYVHFAPLGVVLAVMPWNFPLWQFFRFAAPALMAGNAVVLKHASNVPGCARAIVAMAEKADAPPGLVGGALVRSEDVASLIEDDRIAAVTFTGSTQTGRKIASACGNALKKTVLELGGSDPYLILRDAHLERAADITVKARMVNSGQSCIAAKRFIVVSSLKPKLEALVVEQMKSYRMGDPTDRSTKLGPMATIGLRDELHKQVERSVAAGAKLLLGGEVPIEAGAWYPPTVLTDVSRGMPAYEEELFGPVAAIIGARDDEQAIEIANDSRFGLGAAVFTSDRSAGERIAREELHAGCCFVNDAVRSDPRLPFGGVGDSGYGRELSWLGIREFVNAKTVYVAASDES
jgi:succinate-semialdehyde dehydrogenase/glutarate-semialdehyde dehydrogenase